MTDADSDRRGPTATLFATLLREEWRLHVRLFGGWRFALFPVVVAGLSVGATVALLRTGTASERIVGWGHLLALGFGLYSGTAAFTGSDMLEGVFGRLTFVLSSSETLPLSRRRLLGAFLLKDGLFYAVAFVLPMALGAAVLSGLGPRTPGLVATAWLSLSLVFAAGMALTVASIAARSRGVPVWLSLPAIGFVGVLAWTSGYGAILETALVPMVGPPTSAIGLSVATVAVVAASLLCYDPTYGQPTRTATDRFARLCNRLPTDDDALVAKTLLDLARSSGGVWKPFVSAGVLLVLVAALVGVVDAITGIEPAPGVFFGGVLGLSAFTTYNWLTQFDSLEDYLVYPVSVPAVFRAKRIAFVLVGAPTVAVPYLAAVFWFEATLVDAVVGAALLAGYASYYFGLTVYLAGFDPNEFLFDALRFGAFTAGVAVPLVPTLVVGFVVVPPSTTLALALAAAGFVLGVLGYVLSSWAGPRWEQRYRSGVD
ncbi:hypothetical protein EA472_11165 [Natrarchaeobius oligotrophus]|uniref:Uncharacterized protein n=2 Tax=Natrarchaeobius TaxID=2501796 RepID=A0A3N6NMA2_NATCH|nr:hypothetical protein [Natrarchaeobius chitinivorans]RQH00533.1 hypothetical protein EA472_11165 [Natrarchaeobius chitinivorans]